MSRSRTVALFSLLIFTALWALVVVDWPSYWHAVTGP